MAHSRDQPALAGGLERKNTGSRARRDASHALAPLPRARAPAPVPVGQRYNRNLRFHARGRRPCSKSSLMMPGCRPNAVASTR